MLEKMRKTTLTTLFVTFVGFLNSSVYAEVIYKCQISMEGEVEHNRKVVLSSYASENFDFADNKHVLTLKNYGGEMSIEVNDKTVDVHFALVAHAQFNGKYGSFYLGKPYTWVDCIY